MCTLPLLKTNAGPIIAATLLLSGLPNTGEAIEINPDAAWPAAFHDDKGSQASAFRGPITGEKITVSLESTVATILTRPGLALIQPYSGKFLYPFEPDNIAAGPSESIYVGTSFPEVGGGILDGDGYTWFNVKNRVVRFEPDSRHMILSEAFPGASNETTSPKSNEGYNGQTILPDGNLLISGFGSDLHVIGTQVNGNTFPILNSEDLQGLMWEGSTPLDGQMDWDPRPVIDDTGYIYVASEKMVVRLGYDLDTFELHIDWMYHHDTSSDASLTAAKLTLIGELICFKTEPLNNSIAMDVICLDQHSGKLQERWTPFPEVLGKGGRHTIGTLEAENALIVFVASEHPLAGVVRLQIGEPNPIWRINLPGAVETMSISLPSSRAYFVTKMPDSPLLVHAIDTNNGSATLLTSYGDSRTRKPHGALTALGNEGELYVPLSGGFLQVKD